MKYPIAPNGIFKTIQGEGILSGHSMIFIRLAGCDINCNNCDTDYSVFERLSIDEIYTRVSQLVTTPNMWVWITGGEPTIHNLLFLCDRLNRAGLKVAIATAGERQIHYAIARIQSGPQFISVSPHNPNKLVMMRGDQVNLVDGLNNVPLSRWIDYESAFSDGYSYCYVTPLWGDSSSLRRCLNWIEVYTNWRLNIQAHKYWNLP